MPGFFHYNFVTVQHLTSCNSKIYETPLWLEDFATLSDWFYCIIRIITYDEPNEKPLTSQYSLTKRQDINRFFFLNHLHL